MTVEGPPERAGTGEVSPETGEQGEDLVNRPKVTSENGGRPPIPASPSDADEGAADVDDGCGQPGPRSRPSPSRVSDDKHASAIVAGCIALERYIGELRDTLVRGEPSESAGVGGKALPLPAEEAQRVEKIFQELYEEIEVIRKRFDRDHVRRPPDLSLTYMWASVLLGKMEEVVETLKPDRLEKTRGGLPPDDKEFLSERLSVVERMITGLRDRYTTYGPRSRNLDESDS